MTVPAAALVLAAGLGTRLRPLTCVRAKPAVPVAGRPLIVRIITALVAAGVREIVVNLHHLPETVTREVGDGDGLGARVRYSWEPVVLGSGGGPRHALPLLGREAFLIVNGDTLTDVDLEGLLRAHTASGAGVTMALTANPDPLRYGGVVVEDDGIVQGFTKAGDPRPSYHFVGVQIAEPHVFDALDDHVPAESVNGLYRTLIARSAGVVRGWTTAAAFHDVGTPGDYLRCCRTFASAEGAPLTGSGRRTRIARDATLIDTVLWDDVEVGAGASLQSCIVVDGVTIPSGAVLRDRIVLPGAGHDGDGTVVDGMRLFPFAP